MKLVEQIQRSLSRAAQPATQPHAELLARLRREITRIERRSPPPREMPPPWEVPAPRETPLPWEVPPPRVPATSAAMPRMPLPVDDEGLLYCHQLSRGERLGRTRLACPDEALLRQLEQVLALELGWEPQPAQPLRAEELCFLDLETTGLSRSTATLAFLMGTGCWSATAERGLQVTQILLQDPAQEPLALARLEERLAQARVLITFNGRGFDIPVLRNRSLLNRAALSLEDKPHLDLLPLCRRLFRSRVTNCRLVTLERELLGFVREWDVDGAEAPRIYDDWLRTGLPGELPLLIEHNRLDVALMAPLLDLVVRHLADPLEWGEDAEELLAAGRMYLQDGQPLGARCLERGLELARRPVTRRRLLEALARHVQREGRAAEAASYWEQMRDEFPLHNAGWVELAKYHEHVTGDLARALALVERAPHRAGPPMQTRLERLRRRVARAEQRRAKE